MLYSSDKVAQLREAMEYVYTNHISDFDWILKTTDSTFNVLENLRHMLYQYDTDWPLVVGLRFLKEVCVMVKMTSNF